MGNAAKLPSHRENQFLAEKHHHHYNEPLVIGKQLITSFIVLTMVVANDDWSTTSHWQIINHHLPISIIMTGVWHSMTKILAPQLLVQKPFWCCSMQAGDVGQSCLVLFGGGWYCIMMVVVHDGSGWVGKELISWWQVSRMATTIININCQLHLPSSSPAVHHFPFCWTCPYCWRLCDAPICSDLFFSIWDATIFGFV